MPCRAPYLPYKRITVEFSVKLYMRIASEAEDKENVRVNEGAAQVNQEYVL